MRRKQFAITDKYWNFPSSTDVNQPLHHIQIQVIFEKKMTCSIFYYYYYYYYFLHKSLNVICSMHLIVLYFTNVTIL